MIRAWVAAMGIGLCCWTACGQAHHVAADGLRAADNALLYQRDTGGWPKNYDRLATLTQQERQQVLGEKSSDDATIDNGATHTEIRLLARAYRQEPDARYRVAALRGIEYLLDGQYDNGGWPQCFPRAHGYQRYITFNDGAMIGVLRLLRDVAAGEEVFAFVPDVTRRRCRRAVERGIECMLACQVRVRGRRTVWCAQHDHVTFAPRQGRSYELASLSGAESVGVVRFLMEIDDPSLEVVQAIEGAVDWFERSQLEDLKLVRVDDDRAPRGFDWKVVHDPEAGPMWARFYDIQTNQPIFCSRDGVPRDSLAKISCERRTGYSWLGAYARELLTHDLPAWRRRINPPRTVGDAR